MERKKRKKTMKCPFKYRKDCKEVDTSGMTKLKTCDVCDWFNNGVRESGGVIIADLFKNIWIYTKAILFIIGLFIFLVFVMIWLQLRLLWARIKGKEYYRMEYISQDYMLRNL
jgi:hypothetical protein